MTVKYDIEFLGHPNIRSLHQRTIEITKDSSLTPSGDCIIGVNATSACKEIPQELRKKLQDPKTLIKITISVGDYVFVVNGRGHSDLTLTHSHDIVIRKSNFVCPRTLGVEFDKGSDSIPREMIKLLQDPYSKGVFSIEVN